MSKLYASLFLLANVFTSISNGEACADAKLTCNTVTITLDPASTSLNGVYTKVANENNLYQKGNFYFAYYAAGGYYYISEEDRRCARSVSYNAKVEEPSLSSLSDGGSVSFTPTFPSDRTITIACEGVATVAKETGIGSFCLTTGYTGTITTSGPSSFTYDLADIAGTYTELADNINGKPAYELSSTCGQSSTLMYVHAPYYAYRFVSDVNSASTTAYLSCTNTDSINNHDITQCTEWGSAQINQLLTVSTSNTCQCGLTPTPAPSAPPTPASQAVQGLGDICLTTGYTGTLTGAISTALADLAGKYTEIGNINGLPAYELVSECNQESATLMYVKQGYNDYMFVRDVNNPTTTYYLGCDNTDSITDGIDITECLWGNDQINALLTVATSATCNCGLTPTPAPSAPPTPTSEAVQGFGSVCFGTTFTGTLNSGSGISTPLADLAGEYTEIANINGLPAYELVSACNQESSTLMYSTEFAKYAFVRDVSNPVGSYYATCKNSNPDVTQCTWGNINDLITVSSGSSSCVCGLTPTPSPTKAPVVPVTGLGDICFSTTRASISDQAGTYNEMTGNNIDGKPAYQLSSTCGGQTYTIRYSTAYGRYMLVTDQNNPHTYVNYCQTNLPNDDLTQCVFGYWQTSQESVSIDASCACGGI